MAEQRKAAAAGDHNTVTHEPAAPAPEPQVSDAAKRTSKDKRVTLRVSHPHALFDLSGAGLANVTQAGTTYSEGEADQVKTLALKYGVPVTEVAPDTEETAK
ncbi:hypothetical protein SEA_ARACELI_21 [Streptomyces phage Araceli]|nr:hypothetical protein SEA_HENOCCUS_21 [Streptomyces phage Henoccus]AWY07339.1 hypothetical protein SEA_JACKIEB_20 [Streptomyces phage JackieB]QFG07835.1 hypothetical protein SEA_ARACELI_21 [Streptomyces phage Araceli]